MADSYIDSFKQNFLAPNGFKFSINRLPHVSFYVQQANIPGINAGVTEQASPFKNIYRHGDKITYDDLILTVRLDEEMQSYIEVVKWLERLTSASSFSDYSKAKDESGNLYSDATLIVLDSRQNPIIQIYYKDIFPVSISAVQMATTDTDIEYVTADFSFKINAWDIEYMGSRKSLNNTI